VVGGIVRLLHSTEPSNGVVIARNLVSGEADALIEIERSVAGDQTLHRFLPGISSTSVNIDPSALVRKPQRWGRAISEGGFAYPWFIDLGETALIL